MKTSISQLVALVEFIEKNGDLSKPSGRLRGRRFIQKKWKELTEKLNSDESGDTRSEENWLQVWSELKNNTTMKMAEVHRAARGPAGGPAPQSSLTDLENRVMQIVGVQAATGMGIPEAGFGLKLEEEETTSTTPLAQPDETLEAPTETTLDTSGSYLLGWNVPSTEPLVFQSPPVASMYKKWNPKSPLERKQKKSSMTKLLIATARTARERDRIIIERERQRQRDVELRLREFEMRERIRQRDLEIQLQAQWLEFMKGAMNVLAKCIDKK